MASVHREEANEQPRPRCRRRLLPRRRGTVRGHRAEGLFFSRTRQGGLVEVAEAGSPRGIIEEEAFALDLETSPASREAGAWVGSPTSGLSVRRRALDRFLPLSAGLEASWRTRADDCLVRGLSLSHARRIYLHRALVEYRVHGANAFFGRPCNDAPPERVRQMADLDAELRRRLCLPVPTLDSIARHAVRLWRSHGGTRRAAFHRAWKHPRRIGLSQDDIWGVRRRFLLHLMGLRRLGRRP
ncbi:MAG TPA: hypothetical protein VFG59_20545 [Anaeromyxobacter sp.]|nr:hypothetical protein [Anaeromyxobacter sp.]